MTIKYFVWIFEKYFNNERNCMVVEADKEYLKNERILKKLASNWKVFLKDLDKALLDNGETVKEQKVVKVDDKTVKQYI